MPEALLGWEQAFEMLEAGHPDATASPHCSAHPDTVGWCYYAAARVRAGWGEQHKALAHLNRAVDNGWMHKRRLQEDPDLAGLRDTAGWDALLDRLV